MILRVFDVEVWYEVQRLPTTVPTPACADFCGCCCDFAYVSQSQSPKGLEKEGERGEGRGGEEASFSPQELTDTQTSL